MIDYSAYLEVCRTAAADEEVFKNFKRHPDYTPILEHVNYEQGMAYLEEIKREFPYLLDHIKRFATNDDIGSPYLHGFYELDLFLSPSTLRYIKVLADLMNLFGRLDDLNIVEIGGGYGGQCKIISDICVPRTYTIIDLPECLLLTEKYLLAQKVNNFILRTIGNTEIIHYDLCISNYAFTEISRAYQDFFIDKIINHSDKGYMTCNFITPENRTKEEIFALKSNYKIYEERPLTAGDNLIYTWQ
jgi:putative sugar O-methyltransferase